MKVMLVGNGKVNNVIKENYSSLVVGVIDDVTDIINDLPDVIIDFSHPVLLDKTIYYAMKYNVPVVIGTTGYNEEKTAQIRELSEKVPVLVSRNFSNGMLLIKKIITDNLDIINSYKKTIIERHNSLKKDSPSGTALMLGDLLSTKNIYSYRDPFFVGEHDIVLENENEIIIFSHKVLNRGVFAAGAIKAAKWLINKEQGLYEFEDGINE